MSKMDKIQRQCIEQSMRLCQSAVQLVWTSRVGRESGLLWIPVGRILRTPNLEPELHHRKCNCLPYTKPEA